jgi:hypothetical protein
VKKKIFSFTSSNGLYERKRDERNLAPINSEMAAELELLESMPNGP